LKKTYYLFNPGRLSRKDNTLKFTPIDETGREGKPKYIPVEGVSDLYCFGSLDANSALFNFLGKNQIGVHFFDYYEHYTGSFCPKEYLLAGKMQICQTDYYRDNYKRLTLARRFVEGGCFNMLKNLKYYQNRDKDLQNEIALIEEYQSKLHAAEAIDQLMGLEGNIRQIYYQGFDIILKEFIMAGRTRQPPRNEVNTLVSFGNMMCYTLCLGMIYHTQLNPTISFLHEPGTRRYSLALDLSEIFKPLLVDRTIFKVMNRKQLSAKDFTLNTNGCHIKESGKKTFIKAFEERLQETIKHRTLGRSVSYKHLVKLECYKLSKHLLGIESYQPFKAWW